MLVFKQEVINKYGRDDFEILLYTKRTDPITIKCSCGHIFTLDRANRLLDKTRKNICPKCLKKKSPTQQEISITYQHKYNYWVEKIGKNKYEILEPYTYYSKKITLKCKKCGSITKRSIESLLKKSDCLSCELALAPKTHQKFLEQVKELEGEDYTVLTEYKKAHEKIKMRHCCGFIYETTPHNFLSRNRRCPKCGRKESNGELKIEKVLKSLNIKYERQKRFEEYKRRPYDFYLPDYNLLIEYNGIQHYQPVDFFGGEEQFERQQNIDKEKNEFAKTIGELLIISYKEYPNIEDILTKFFQSSTTIENSKNE